MFGKKPGVETPTDEKPVFEQAINWESSRVLSVEKSERRAWRVAFASVGVAVLAIAAIAMMMPLKESVPYVIRVDNTTGVPDIVTAITDKAVTGDEVMDKYWLAQYVRARETYDWYTLQRDYNTVGLLSSANVGQGYAQLFEGKDALDKTYGKTVRATVEILSVVPTGKNTGTVRFIKTTKRVDQEGSPGTVTKWVATVAYEYRSTALIKESARLVNPFGFQVLTYRVDPEMVGSVQ
uniref:VirB8 n=1 Tax=Collimonas fungivorans (strain Ter331) TaxID=1005048 RepID=B0ZB77_COLFT|nr:VirB8/TrbF family protein [Collimonas fungivorans]ABZ01498.1 VirB8 [Collimonas fungivorans Ter331]